MNRSVLAVGFATAAVLLAILFSGLGSDPQAIESPLIGKAAPPFVLRQVATGRTMSLDELRGKPLVINFWATWCAPCYEEHPLLVDAARRDSRAQFLGIVFQDTEENIQRFLRQRGSSYPTVVDEAGKIAIAYGVGGVPETFFINADGVIVAKYSGALTPDALYSNLEKAVQP